MAYSQPDFGKLTQAALNPARLGTVDLFKATKGTAYDTALAWTYLGRVKAGTFKNDFTRKFFDVMTGIPETMKESFVTGVDGKMEFTLIEPTIDAYLLASGNATRIPMFGGSPLTTTAATGTLTTTQMSVASATGFAVGDMIEITRGATKMYTYITAINGVIFDMYPKLSVAAQNSDNVKKVRGWETGMGGSSVERIALRAVFHATDGNQIVTWAKDARSMGVKDEFGDKTIVEIPLSFECFGFTDANFTGPILAKKYLLTPDLALTYD